MNLSRNGKWGIVAVAAVALVAAGAALAAAKIHTGGQPAAAVRGGAFGRPLPGPGPGVDLSAAARYLGIGSSTLFRELRSGKSLAQIANGTSGKSASGLIDALVAAARRRFGGSTAQLKAQVTALVNGSGILRDRGREHGDDDGDDGDDDHGDDDGGGSSPPPATTVPPTHI